MWIYINCLDHQRRCVQAFHAPIPVITRSILCVKDRVLLLNSSNPGLKLFSLAQSSYKLNCLHFFFYKKWRAYKVILRRSCTTLKTVLHYTNLPTRKKNSPYGLLDSKYIEKKKFKKKGNKKQKVKQE